MFTVNVYHVVLGMVHAKRLVFAAFEVEDRRLRTHIPGVMFGASVYQAVLRILLAESCQPEPLHTDGAWSFAWVVRTIIAADVNQAVLSMFLAEGRPLASLHVEARMSHTGTVRTVTTDNVDHTVHGMLFEERRLLAALVVEGQRR